MIYQLVTLAVIVYFLIEVQKGLTVWKSPRQVCFDIIKMILLIIALIYVVVDN